MPQVGRVQNLFVARTFSKAYGMAGLRAGVLAGSAEQMRMVRRVSSPYNVNVAALACLPEALADREYVRDYVTQVRDGRERGWSGNCAALGLPFWPSEANFVLCHVGDKREGVGGGDAAARHSGARSQQRSGLRGLRAHHHRHRRADRGG